MEAINSICLSCIHFEKPNGYGCKAYPEGIPYGYPPNNKHDKPIKDQTGNFVYTPVEEEKK